MEEKHIDPEEFKRLGYLQEANRLFFHPLGLALQIKIDFDGKWSLHGIRDCREDPEGIAFEDLGSPEDAARADFVRNEMEKRAKLRECIVGAVIQQIGSRLRDSVVNT